MKRSTIALISGLVLTGTLLLTHPISASSNDALVLHNYVCKGYNTKIAKETVHIAACFGKTWDGTKLGRTTFMLQGQSMNATPKQQGYLWESTNKSTYRARWIGSQFVKRGETPRY